VTLEENELAKIQPGGCFGEMVYFAPRQGRRHTTVTARSEVTVVEIRASALRNATRSDQQAPRPGHPALREVVLYPRRLAAKLTQREVAERARTRQSLVSRLESGALR
jgi:CRP-like cAMP-binding protein